jgi:hypothetical protein
MSASLPLPPSLLTFHPQHLTLCPHSNAQLINHATDKYHGKDKENEDEYKHANEELGVRGEDDVLVERDHGGWQNKAGVCSVEL